ncbi:MAG: hypothetical protein LBD82_04320 [Deltaproteobacteria bacterium]|jgi:hypothetical protein|nr:hypothetical protein [Deltaproteobacteria bacterium]
MSIDSINAYSMSLTDFLTTSEKEAEDDSVASVLSKTSKNNAYAVYGGNMHTGAGQAAMLLAVEELRARTGGPVTFDMVRDYRAELEKEFSLLMQVGLYAQGITESEDFYLIASSEGNIDVNCVDPVLKEKVSALLAENPDLSEQFLFIQALGNVERSKQVGSTLQQQRETKANMGMQAVDIFLNAAVQQGMGYSSLLGAFEGNQDSAQFFLGANLTV